MGSAAVHLRRRTAHSHKGFQRRHNNTLPGNVTAAPTGECELKIAVF